MRSMLPTASTGTSEAPVCTTLSMEEVYVLLRLLRGAAMPGLDLTPFELDALGIPSEPARRALAAATNGLIARGVAKPIDLTRPNAAAGDGVANQGALPWKLELPADVIAMLGACAFGDYTLRLTLLSSAGVVNVYLHELQRVGVIHTIPMAGVHTFTGLRGRQGVLEEVRSLLGLQKQAAEFATSFTVPESTLYAARDTALMGKHAAAVNLLQGAGVPGPEAAAFAAAMADGPSLGAAAVAWRARDGAQREQQFAFVVGQSTCFILAQTETPVSLYHVQAVSASQLLEYVQARLSSVEEQTRGTRGS